MDETGGTTGFQATQHHGGHNSQIWLNGQPTFLVGVTSVLVCRGGRETFLTARLGLVGDLGVAGGVLFR